MQAVQSDHTSRGTIVPHTTFVTTKFLFEIKTLLQKTITLLQPWSDRTPFPREDYTRNRLRIGRNSPHPKCGFQDYPTLSGKIRSHHYITSPGETSELIVSDSETDMYDMPRRNFRTWQQQSHKARQGNNMSTIISRKI